MKKIIFIWLFVIASSFCFSADNNSDDNEESLRRFANYFVPGLLVANLTTFNGFHSYMGGGFHLSLANLLFQDLKGSKYELSPAYWEMFIEINLYKGLSPAISDDYIFNYLLGANISFDRSLSIKRYFLIPYYGVKGGGIYINNNNIEYNGVALVPFLGLSFVRTRFLMINLDCSLLLSTIRFKETLAFSPNFLISFSL